jgi:4-hydroxythreonine-4-phosphate dehydrogenase
MMRPLVAVTMGDPVGIGPEVVVKAASVADVNRDARMVVIGDPGVLRKAAVEASLSIELCVVPAVEQAHEAPEGSLPVLALSELKAHDWGRPDEGSDRAQLAYIEAAVDALKRGALSAMATAPISKSAIHRAGSRFAGHTDLLGASFHTASPVMMLAGPSLKVIPLTIHIPLRDVPQYVQRERVAHAVMTADAAFKRYFAHPHPRIGVAGLNPHAGEEGMFGDEEALHISPAVAECRDRGVDVRGPYPGDSVFHRALNGEFDVVIGMYHDQALIPLKLLDFDQGVNVTLGLPVIRTSVDHGTAYDIAGQGVASAHSMIEAIRMAAQMVRAERKQMQGADP